MDKSKSKIRSLVKTTGKRSNDKVTTRKLNRKKTASLKSVTRKFKRDTNVADLKLSRFKRREHRNKNDYFSPYDAVFAEPERFMDGEVIETSFSLNNSIPWADSALHNKKHSSSTMDKMPMDGNVIETSFSLNNSIPWADSAFHNQSHYSSITDNIPAHGIVVEEYKDESGKFSDYSFVSTPQSPLSTNEYYENDEILFKKLNSKQNVKTKQEKLKNIKSIVFDKRRVKYLNTICSDSGECLAFGRESAEIRKVFTDFIDFRHLKKTKRVGQPSSNGFVLNLYYETMNYKANALLKSSRGTLSDNLFYEYLVGILFINKINQIFPCFTETYHLFKHNSTDTKNLIETNSVHVNNYSTFVKLNNCDKTIAKNMEECIDDSCKNGGDYAILVQYINNPISIESFMKKQETDPLFEQQMLCILYQIYYPLSYLKENFTHYDLHTENVLLYKLPIGKFVSIQYRNITTGTVTNINTNYIAKIIDYGRCFFGDFGDNKLMSSKSILKNVNDSFVCKTKGINEIGFNFRDRNHTVENHYISCLMKNKSHDLRLASMVVKRSRKMKNLFGSDRIIYTGSYGTPENNRHDDYHIHNLDDMIKFLDDLMKREVPSVSQSDTPIGMINVQLRGSIADRMVFTPVE